MARVEDANIRLTWFYDEETWIMNRIFKLVSVIAPINLLMFGGHTKVKLRIAVVPKPLFSICTVFVDTYTKTYLDCELMEIDSE